MSEGKARVMKVRFGRLGVAVLIAGLVAGVFAPAAQASLRERTAMKRATNVSRLDNQVRRVMLDRQMSLLARKHSIKMARQQSLFHTSDPSNYYLKGRNWSYWGENVGVTGGTVKDLQRAFMASSGHRHNVLNRTFRRVAIGAVRRNGVLWVTIFFYG